MTKNYITNKILEQLKPKIEYISIIIYDLVTFHPQLSIDFVYKLKNKGIVETFRMQDKDNKAYDPEVQLYLQIIQGIFGVKKRIFDSEDIWDVISYMNLTADTLIKICEKGIKK